MAAVASPPVDAQPQENGNPHTPPPEHELPAIAKSNDAAVQQNSFAEGDPMALDTNVAPTLKPDVPLPTAPALSESAPISDPQPEPALPVTDAETSNSMEIELTPAPVNNIGSVPTSLQNGSFSATDQHSENGVTDVVEPPDTDSLVEAQPESQPAASTEITAAMSIEPTTTATPVIDDAPPAVTEAPVEQAPEPSEPVSAPTNVETVTADSAPVKVAREREEDVDTEEPAAKRTKTGEGTQEADAPASPPALDTAQPPPSATTEVLLTPATPGLASSSWTKEDWGDMTEVQQKRLLEGMRNLKKGKHASLFSKPVDPVAMGLPTYFDIIKQPMDLSTMENKLKNREYPSVVDYIADFDLMVSNAIAFNGQAHPVAQGGMMVRSQLEAQLRKLPKLGDPVPEPASKPKRPSLPGPTRELQRRESRQSLGNVAQSPSMSYAPDPNGVPLARRDSNVADRPKRRIQKPPPREIQYGKPQKKKYRAELLFAGEVLTEMERPRYKDVCAAPFLNPVDPVALGIPNYHQIIKKPIDVSTIRQKYNDNQYENFREFDADFKLMFKNCYRFNPDGHPINGMGHQYEQIYDEQVAKKNERVKALAPPSARESPDDEDDDEEEDEEESEDDEETQRQKQLSALNEQLKLLQAQAQTLMGQGPAKAAKGAKEKKGKANKPEIGKKKKKSSGVGAAPPPKEKKAKPKGKPKNKPLTQKDKEEIASRIFELPTDEINVIADKIKKAMRDRGQEVADEAEMEFNIDDIPDEILHEILKKLRNIDARVQKGGVTKDDDDDYDAKPDVSGSYAPKNKRNRPMSRTDTANQMAAIQQQIDSFSGGNATSPPAKMESSDDDETGSESEEE